MTNTSVLLYNTLDASKKDAQWCNLQVTLMRRDWRKLVNSQRAWVDRAFMFSVEDMKVVRDSFDDEDFKKTVKFLPLPILDPMLNAIVEEITRNPPKAELRANDPTALIEKKSDINLIKNRAILEKDRTEVQQKTFGEDIPPYKIDYDKFNGNVDEFDRLGLDPEDQEDLNFYEENFQRLKYEIAGQAIINAIFNNNKFDKQTIRKLAKDIFAMKTICVQKYIDQITGEIKDAYIDPQSTYGIFGTTNDGTDDICRGFQDSITVMEWLQRVGNEFNFDRDWRYLLWGINYCNIRKFTGFIRNGVPFDCCANPGWMNEMGLSDVNAPELIDWSMAYTYKVYVGYIEWRSPEASVTFMTNKTNSSFLDIIPYDYQLKKKQIKEGYETESRYQIPWYRSYFIATTSVSQWIWGFGKVFMQSTTGANDEYSNGTLCYYQEEGLSATEISFPYLQVANFTFYRMLWVIFKAKPDADEYVYEELIQLAGQTQRQFNQQQGVNTPVMLDTVMKDIIKQMRQKHVRIRTYPRIDGRAVNQIYPIEKKNSGGLDPIAIAMQAVTNWAEQNIAMKIGMNQMRLGGNPPPRESTQTEENAVQFSMATTGYFYRMLQYLKEHLAVASLNYAQDIIRYKPSMPYKWLQKQVGEQHFENLKVIDKFSAHRYAMFFDDYNSNIDKQDIKDSAKIALEQGGITWDQWFMVTQTKDVKWAAILLGHYKMKERKRLEKMEQDKMQAADALEEKRHKNVLEEIGAKNAGGLAIEQERSRSFILSTQLQAQSKLQVKEAGNAAEPVKAAAKAAAATEIESNKQNLQEQKVMP